MKFKHLLVATIAAAAFSAPFAAHAAVDVWSVTYGSTDNNTPFTLSGTLTTSSTFNVNGGLDALSFNGTVDGDPVTLATMPAGTPPNVGLSHDGAWYGDQTFYWKPVQLDALVSYYGLVFQSTANPNVSYNAWDNGTNQTTAGGNNPMVTLQQFTGGVGYTETSNGIMVASLVSGPTPGGVPEPATWALMILGFGGAGAALRKRRQTSMQIA